MYAICGQTARTSPALGTLDVPIAVATTAVDRCDAQPAEERGERRVAERRELRGRVREPSRIEEEARDAGEDEQVAPAERSR